VYFRDVLVVDEHIAHNDVGLAAGRSAGAAGVAAERWSGGRSPVCSSGIRGDAGYFVLSAESS
jgi:hypothetical protein